MAEKESEETFRPFPKVKAATIVLLEN